jgi:hypothetical protein
MQDVIDSTLLAKKKLVSISSRNVSTGSGSVAAQGRPVGSRKGPKSVIPRHSSIRPSRLEFMRSTLRNKGISDRVVERILKSKKNSTCKIYQCRWDAFHRWCQRKELQVHLSDVNIIAEFLIDLFEKQQSQSTIKGHLSTILNTLAVRDREIIKADNPILMEVIRGFTVERPITPSVAPKWDLSMILHALTKHPFEPELQNKDFKLITWKTLVLTLLASAKRRGHIFHLDHAQLAVAENLSEMTIGVFPEFSSKTEACLGHPIDHTITIPALTEASEKEDQFLCPVRALRIYIQVTASFRRGRRRLFLPICREKEDFTAATMTNWMKGLISRLW